MNATLRDSEEGRSAEGGGTHIDFLLWSSHPSSALRLAVCFKTEYRPDGRYFGDFLWRATHEWHSLHNFIMQCGTINDVYCEVPFLMS